MKLFPLSFKHTSLLVLLATLLIRLISLNLVPLTDNTEARYGNIARIMVQTDNWITPQIEPGRAFWAKPPLSIWTSALSLKFFGVNEFAVRFPSFLMGLIVLWLTSRMVLLKKNSDSAMRTLVILALMPVFIVSIGAVMTDAALLLGTTLAMVSFGIVVTEEKPYRIWGYLFFVGLAIGMLTKGPIAVVLVGIPTFLWTIWQRKWALVWRKIPWITGFILMLLLSGPWYFIAEKKTPGFLEYFFVGEHWRRFTIPGWKGDLYGQAHSRPHGMIWLFWLLATMPWVLVFLYAVRNKVSRLQFKSLWNQEKEWHAYLLVWSFSSPLFFSLAGNILWTYVLPGMPAFAILISEIFQSKVDHNPSLTEMHNPVNRWFTIVISAILAVLALLMIPLAQGRMTNGVSQKKLINQYFNIRSDKSEKLTYLFEKPCSADFYSEGVAELVKDVNQIEPIKADQHRDFFAIRKIKRMPPAFLNQLDDLGKFGSYYLFREKD